MSTIIGRMVRICLWHSNCLIVRWYDANDWDNKDTINVDVYGEFYVQHYTRSGANGALSFVGEEPHYFGQCPANVFSLPDEKSIFDCILGLQDSANEILSQN